ncbi:MAG: small basic protein [Planctomycetota bacterium]|nr:MAG: small basic protein [Planctomycetota bacterium]
MSIHKSLKLSNSLVRRRNVLKRNERIAEMMKVGRWKDGDPLFGLPKIFIDSAGLVHVIREDKTPKTITQTASAPPTPSEEPKKKK